jgi:signal transduction histidine kinase
MTAIDWDAFVPHWAHDRTVMGMLTTDTSLAIRGWNRWLETHSGRPAATMIGRNMLDAFPELAERHLDAVFRQALAGQVSWLSQRLHHYLIPMPAGDDQALFEYMQQSVRIGPLLDGGSIVGTIAIIDDVTERVAYEEELKRLLAQERTARAEAETMSMWIARLQAVTAALSEAMTPEQVAEVVIQQGGATLGARAGLIALVSEDGAALEIARAFGYPGETLETWRRFPLDLPTPLADAVRTREPIVLASQREYARRYPQLADQYATLGSGSLVALPLLAEGRTTGVLGLSFAGFRTFSADEVAFARTLAHQSAQAFERARLYEAERSALAVAREALKTRDVFFSIASHELKTPLTSLLGNAQLLHRRSLRDNNLPERERRAVGVIAEQAARLNKMIAALLDISRIEMGHLSIAPAPVDLSALVSRVVGEVQPSLTLHSISWSAPAEQLIVEGDELRLEQVLQNLIQNAIKYSPTGGTVTVQLVRDGDSASVRVSDQGIGIPQAALPQLFQRFYRADNADAQYISGMGIGLYVVKEIVSLHGGTVAVESTLGSGSTFTICLPLQGS